MVATQDGLGAAPPRRGLEHIGEGVTFSAAAFGPGQRCRPPAGQPTPLPPTPRPSQAVKPAPAKPEDPSCGDALHLPARLAQMRQSNGTWRGQQDWRRRFSACEAVGCESEEVKRCKVTQEQRIMVDGGSGQAQCDP